MRAKIVPCEQISSQRRPRPAANGIIPAVTSQLSMRYRLQNNGATARNGLHVADELTGK